MEEDLKTKNGSLPTKLIFVRLTHLERRPQEKWKTTSTKKMEDDLKKD